MYFLTCELNMSQGYLRGVPSRSTLFTTPSPILDTTLGSKFYLFKFKTKYGKELRRLNTKGKYGKVIDTKIKWSIISKSVTKIISVEFIDRLIVPGLMCTIRFAQDKRGIYKVFRFISPWKLMSWVLVRSSSFRRFLCIPTALSSFRKKEFIPIFTVEKRDISGIIYIGVAIDTHITHVRNMRKNT